MPTTRQPLKLFAAIVVKNLFPLLLGASLGLMCFSATAGDYDPAQVKWSQLTFRTTVLFITLQATVGLEKLTASEAEPALIKPKTGEGVSPGQKDVYLLKSHTAKFGRNSTLKLWFEGDLTPLQRMEIETGRKNIVRTYRFLPDGAFRRDLAPTKGEKGQPPARWTKNSSHYYPYPDRLPPLKMTDNAAIFYAVSAAHLNKKGDKVVFLTFDKKHINEVTLLCEGFADIDANYFEQSKTGKKRIRGAVKALRVALQSRPIDRDKDKKDFTFLGVKGDINIYLDPKSHIPLQVTLSQ
jgi:hypothetical protein